ncbi:MAG: ROK family protein [Candidatus Margulisiibacteriota bacterium]
MKDLIVGIDLGGTKIAGVLANEAGKVITDITIPTEALLGREKVIQNIKKAIYNLIHKNHDRLKAIGIGLPGPILYEKGIVISPPNLPGWKKVNLKKILEKEFKIPIFVDNDANCAALAEAKYGAGKKAKHFIYMTVSTGIGGGIIIDRKLYRGMTGAAGEFGHMIIDSKGYKCGCGNVGCLEALASGTAIKKRSGMEGYAVELAARNGDKKALKVIETTAHYLSIGLANLVNIFNPEMIIIGGGVSQMRELLFKPIRKEFKEYALPLPAKSVKIVRAKLGTKAGVLGAVALCL